MFIPTGVVGFTHSTVTKPSLARATTLVGAEAPPTNHRPEKPDTAPVTAALDAATTTSYDTPLVRPVIKHEFVTPLAGTTYVQDLDGSLEIRASYDTIGPPPVLKGACQEILADLSFERNTTERGCEGALSKVIALDGVDATDSPTSFVAFTVNEYV